MTENRKIALAIAYVVVLLAFCIALPLIASTWIHPAAGVLVAVGSIIVWMYFGPPPMPGFINGLIAINGLFAIIGTLIVCIARTARLAWH
jgi:hypothetical protein